MKKIYITGLVLFLMCLTLPFVATETALAQSNGDNNDNNGSISDEQEQKLVEEVNRIVNIEDYNRLSTVEGYLTAVNINQSEYPRLTAEAQQFVNEYENRTQGLDQSRSLNSNLRVEYSFSRSNETVRLLFESDRKTEVSLTDVGATISGDRFDYRQVDVNGRTIVEMDATEVQSSSDYVQGVAIVDLSEEQGYVLRNENSYFNILNSIQWYHIAIASLSGALTLAILSYLFVRKLEDRGKGTLIPLE